MRQQMRNIFLQKLPDPACLKSASDLGHAYMIFQRTTYDPPQKMSYVLKLGVALMHDLRSMPFPFGLIVLPCLPFLPVALMHDLRSMPFPFGLIVLPCLPFLPRLIDTSALQFPPELLANNIAPDIKSAASRSAHAANLTSSRLLLRS